METIRVVEAAFERLYTLEPVTDNEGETTPRVVCLDATAARLWAHWYDEHAVELGREDFPKRLRGPWAKMPAQCARLALILHALWHDPVPDEVDSVTLAHAADLIDEYFKPHARRVYRHLARDRRDLVTVILAALKQHGRLKQSDFLHEVFKRNVPAERIGSALESLQEAGLVKREVEHQAGRPSATYWVLA